MINLKIDKLLCTFVNYSSSVTFLQHLFHQEMITREEQVLPELDAQSWQQSWDVVCIQLKKKPRYQECFGSIIIHPAI